MYHDSQAWKVKPTISALGKLMQKYQDFETSMDCIERPCLKKYIL
jgi:hypothetical protein